MHIDTISTKSKDEWIQKVYKMNSSNHTSWIGAIDGRWPILKKYVNRSVQTTATNNQSSGDYGLNWTILFHLNKTIKWNHQMQESMIFFFLFFHKKKRKKDRIWNLVFYICLSLYAKSFQDICNHGSSQLPTRFRYQNDFCYLLSDFIISLYLL